MAARKAESNGVINLSIFVLFGVDLNQLGKLLRDDKELVANELFEEEDIIVLVEVEKAIHVSTDRPAQLPEVSFTEGTQQIIVGIDVRQFADVDEILAFDEH